MYWFLISLLIFFVFLFLLICVIPHQPEAQSGFSGTCSPEGREEGGTIDPWVSEAQVAAPLEPRRGRALA